MSERAGARTGRRRSASSSRASAWRRLNVATGIAWINPAIFVGMAVLCGLAAIVAGHIGRFRGRRLGGDGRGMALLGILVGWLLVTICVLAVVAVLGLIAGLAVLVDHAQ